MISKHQRIIIILIATLVVLFCLGIITFIENSYIKTIAAIATTLAFFVIRTYSKSNY
jgi:hypothetical protein